MGLDEYAYNVTTVFEQRFVGVFRPHDWLNITVNPSGVYMGMALYDPWKDHFDIRQNIELMIILR